jgi:hypothetical protein
MSSTTMVFKIFRSPEIVHRLQHMKHVQLSVAMSSKWNIMSNKI